MTRAINRRGKIKNRRIIGRIQKQIKLSRFQFHKFQDRARTKFGFALFTVATIFKDRIEYKQTQFNRNQSKSYQKLNHKKSPNLNPPHRINIFFHFPTLFVVPPLSGELLSSDLVDLAKVASDFFDFVETTEDLMIVLFLAGLENSIFKSKSLNNASSSSDEMESATNVGRMKPSE